jgi:hypothetical protein
MVYSGTEIDRERKLAAYISQPISQAVSDFAKQKIMICKSRSCAFALASNGYAVKNYGSVL